jgi:hypothetical protein
MTNWNRSPKGINAGRFIFDGQRRLVADMTSVSDSLVLLKKQNLVETPLGSTSGSSTTIAQLCQQEQAILITADSSYLSLIFSEAKPPWGVLLLPNNPSEQKEECFQENSGFALQKRVWPSQSTYVAIA